MAAARPLLADAQDEVSNVVEIARHRAVGLVIATARKRKGILQAELAEVVGVSPYTVTRWEQGHRPIPTGKHRVIAEHLGISTDAMIVALPASLSEPEAALLDDYHSLEPEVRTAFRTMLAFAAARARTE